MEIEISNVKISYGEKLDEMETMERFVCQDVYEHVLKVTGEDDQGKIFGSNLIVFEIRGLKVEQHFNLVEI